MCTYIQWHVHIYGYIYKRKYVCIYPIGFPINNIISLCIYSYVLVYVYVYICVYAYSYICMCTFVFYKRVCVYAYVLIHTFTHVQTSLPRARNRIRVVNPEKSICKCADGPA